MTLFSAEPDAVHLFQIHQRADYGITLRVVLSEEPYALEAAERAASSLRARVSGQVSVVVEVVPYLPYTSGKIKYVISDATTQ